MLSIRRPNRGLDLGLALGLDEEFRESNTPFASPEEDYHYLKSKNYSIKVIKAATKTITGKYSPRTL